MEAPHSQVHSIQVYVIKLISYLKMVGTFDQTLLVFFIHDAPKILMNIAFNINNYSSELLTLLEHLSAPP